MEGVSKKLIFPDLDHIIDLNQMLIHRYGGLFNGADNLHNPNSLKWVLEAIQYPLFGKDLYPRIIDKSAILSWTINEAHVFHDGNKRTSIFVMLEFILINGYQIKTSNEELRDIALRVANCKTNQFLFSEYVGWLENRISF